MALNWSDRDSRPEWLNYTIDSLWGIALMLSWVVTLWVIANGAKRRHEHERETTE